MLFRDILCKSSGDIRNKKYPAKCIVHLVQSLLFTVAVGDTI